MQWISRLFRGNTDPDDLVLLDIDKLVAAIGDNPEVARDAIKRLRHERKQIERRIKRIQKDLGRQTPRQARQQLRGSGMLGPEIMRAQTQLQDSTSQNAGLAAQEQGFYDRIKRVEEAIATIRATAGV